MWHINTATLLSLVLSHVESNLAAKFTTLVKFPMGFWSRLFHLVGVVLGDFPAAVVAIANNPGVEKSRHSMATPARLTRVSTKVRSWGKKEEFVVKKARNIVMYSADLYLLVSIFSSFICAHLIFPVFVYREYSGTKLLAANVSFCCGHKSSHSGERSVQLCKSLVHLFAKSL